MPNLSIERNYAEASKLPVLRWLGPWRASVSMGQAEGSDVAVPDVRLFAARLSFKPKPWLEFGLSRTAQWCGEGRPCDLGTFGDLLLGQDNVSDSLTQDEEPGNQMAGYDFRLRSPWAAAPVVLYGQMIGEDEAGGLPSKFLGLFGAEVWGGSALGSWRARLEYADTTCDFLQNSPEYPCTAFRSQLYPQGYTYRGRVLAHSMDNDSRSWSVGALLVRPSGTSISITARRLDLNRFGTVDPQHATSPGGASELGNLEFQVDLFRFGGNLSAGLGYDDWSANAPDDSGLHGFLRYRRGL